MASEIDPNEVLDYVTETLRQAHAQLEGLDSETAALMRHDVARALTRAPAPQAKQRERDQGDFEPGTTIGGDDETLKKTQQLEGETPGGAPSPSELLAENARLQERVALLEEAHRNGT